MSWVSLSSVGLDSGQLQASQAGHTGASLSRVVLDLCRLSARTPPVAPPAWRSQVGSLLTGQLSSREALPETRVGKWARRCPKASRSKGRGLGHTVANGERGHSRKLAL